MIAVSLRHEFQLKKLGFDMIAGVDESGIGPLAGPVVAAAVILKDNHGIRGLDDCKKLSKLKREELYSKIISSSVSVGVGIIDSDTIDKINILQASFKAMTGAIFTLSKRPDHILVDGIRTIPEIDIAQTAIKFGDRRSSSIAAASIIAKVTRDAIMDNYDLIYPQFRFSSHKGYGTEEHVRLLRKYGPSPIHRCCYQPVFDCMISHGFILI